MSAANKNRFFGKQRGTKPQGSEFTDSAEASAADTGAAEAGVEDHSSGEFAEQHDVRPDVAGPDSEDMMEVEGAQSDSQLQQLSQRLADAEERAVRYQADLDNFRKRTRREVEEQIKYSTLPLVMDLLEAVDNLERAVNSSEEAADDQLRQGVMMVQHQIHQVFHKHGIRKVESIGHPFDPNFHEAIQMLPNPAPERTILAEFQPGYVLHDRVIRPAKVVLSAGSGSS